MTDLAVIVVDVLNPYEHEDADQLAVHAACALEPIATLVAAAVDAEAELVYVNDNYGDFTATRDDIVRRALEGRHPELVEPIVPSREIDFLQKVRHSAFYSTALDHLLRRREVRTLVLAGQVTEQCVLYTALDAYVRHYEIRVAGDAVVPLDPQLGDAALTMMRRNMRVDVLAAADCLGPA
jgi:nicotinamidase-related amidase